MTKRLGMIALGVKWRALQQGDEGHVVRVFRRGISSA